MINQTQSSDQGSERFATGETLVDRSALGAITGRIYSTQDAVAGFVALLINPKFDEDHGTPRDTYCAQFIHFGVDAIKLLTQDIALATSHPATARINALRAVETVARAFIEQEASLSEISTRDSRGRELREACGNAEDMLLRALDPASNSGVIMALKGEEFQPKEKERYLGYLATAAYVLAIGRSEQLTKSAIETIIEQRENKITSLMVSNNNLPSQSRFDQLQEFRNSFRTISATTDLQQRYEVYIKLIAGTKLMEQILNAMQP